MKPASRFSRWAVAVTALGIFVGITAAPVLAADPPKATQDLIKAHPFLAELLKNAEAEHQIPGDLLAGARKQGAMKITATWSWKQFDAFTKAFQERYPLIKLSYARGSKYDRGLKPLLAFTQGNYVADVSVSFAAFYNQLKGAGALADLRSLVTFKSVAKPFRDNDNGFWVGQKLTYRCMAYNTAKVKRWKGGRLALNNYPHSWLLPLWGELGENWAKDFVIKLFALNPQLRKEGQNASVSLNAAGEFDAVILASGFRTREYRNKGAPVGFHCPEPVPVGPVQSGIIKGSPKEAAARVFLSWHLSKEGQAAMWAATGGMPVHKDLQRREFMAFPDEVIGKKHAFRYQKLVDNVNPRLVKFWNKIWISTAGEKFEQFTAKVKASKRKGRRIVVVHNGKERTLKVSGRRTKVMVNGMENDRKEIKAGMDCAVTYSITNKEPKQISCK